VHPLVGSKRDGRIVGKAQRVAGNSLRVRFSSWEVMETEGVGPDMQARIALFANKGK
jgi:hypothetical protein